jgi:hypothetical protein
MEGRPLTPGQRGKRLALVTLMSVLTLNVWTGSPLLALWIGSRVQGSGPPSMAAIGAVAGSLAVFSVVLVRAISLLSDRYDKLTGRPRGPREPAPWLRSLRSERDQERAKRAGLTALERILVVSVVLVVAAFEAWFFFFSGSPFGEGSGR